MTLAKDRPRVSVVIPTYNRCEMLRDALEHLALQRLPSNEFEVIVSDDGSSDATKAVVDSFTDRLRIKYHFQEDLGFRAAAARNAGARLAEAPLLVFLDTGPLCGPDFLGRHLAAHADESERRAVIGYAYAYNPGKDQSWVTDPLKRLGPVEMAKRYLSDPEFRDVRYELLQKLDFDLGRRHLPWQLFFTINCSVRREDFWAVGGFDEGFNGWGGEDMELGYKLFRRGLRFHLASDAWVVDVPHERDHYNLLESMVTQMEYFLTLHREPMLEIAALTVMRLLWTWEDDYTDLLTWQRRVRDRSVAAELAAAVEHLPKGNKIAVLGSGGDIPPTLPPAILMDFDKALIERASAAGPHTVQHALGLRTALPSKSVDTVVITSRLAGLWERWGHDILVEANRIGSGVYVTELARPRGYAPPPGRLDLGKTAAGVDPL
jgi:glycosyltransferase involved in cell wall biosynthesis